VAFGYPIGQVFLGGGQGQLVASHVGNHPVQGGAVGAGPARHVAKQRRVFARLKQVQPLLPFGPLQLQHHLAAKAHVILGNRDRIPGEAALLPLGNAGLGVFKLELL
jgi:hypothetical protein